MPNSVKTLSLFIAACLSLWFARGFEVQLVAADKCKCPTVVLVPIPESDSIDITGQNVIRETGVSDADDLDVVINATCRVKVGDSGGSGTIVGHDSGGNALILTNAHVAGTTKGRVCQVERWNQNGDRFLGSARIYAAGYSRELSIDFALLRAVGSFGRGVTPVPLVDRPPDGRATNYGSPRFEWPSLQTLKIVKKEGQVLSWYPQAISGRSGSSVIDYSDVGPRVVALLTWGGQGKGYGQSAPFVIDAIRGRLPTSFEPLPPGITEVACCAGNDTVEDITAPPEPRLANPDTGTRQSHVDAMLGKLDAVCQAQQDQSKAIKKIDDAQQQLAQLVVDQADADEAKINDAIRAVESVAEASSLESKKNTMAAIEVGEQCLTYLKSSARRELILWCVLGGVLVIFVIIKAFRCVAWLASNYRLERSPEPTRESAARQPATTESA